MVTDELLLMGARWGTGNLARHEIRLWHQEKEGVSPWLPTRVLHLQELSYQHAADNQHFSGFQMKTQAQVQN